jgi:hypothetical protein
VRQQEIAAEFGEDDSEFISKYGDMVKKVLTMDEDEICNSKISQLKRCPPITKNGELVYPASRSKAFLIKLASCGYGEIIPGRTNKTIKFRKRKAAILSSPAKKFLRTNHLLGEKDDA